MATKGKQVRPAAKSVRKDKTAQVSFARPVFSVLGLEVSRNSSGNVFIRWKEGPRRKLF